MFPLHYHGKTLKKKDNLQKSLFFLPSEKIHHFIKSIFTEEITYIDISFSLRMQKGSKTRTDRQFSHNS